MLCNACYQDVDELIYCSHCSKEICRECAKNHENGLLCEECEENQDMDDLGVADIISDGELDGEFF